MRRFAHSSSSAELSVSDSQASSTSSDVVRGDRYFRSWPKPEWPLWGADRSERTLPRPFCSH